MTTEEKLQLLALLKVDGVGPVIAKNLIAYCGGVGEIWRKAPGFLRKIPEVGEKVISELKKGVKTLDAEKEMRFCIDHEIEVLSYLDEGYPELLKVIHNAPLLLFKRGALNFNQHPTIAIVGTRKCTEYGKDQARRFASYFVENGVNVVSGLAYGIDITAHKEVLDCDGVTTAVLAHGLHTIYPPHHAPQAKKIIEKGALLTEYQSNVFPDGNNFPARNRIIAGISMAVVIIEASEKGGALITGKIAFDQNREVFAVPGPLGAKYSEGCNKLIRDQYAQLVIEPEEVLECIRAQYPDLEISAKEKPKQQSLFTPISQPLTAQEQTVLNILEKGDMVLDVLAEQSSISVSTLISLLLSLEFKGFVKQLPGRKFARS